MKEERKKWAVQLAESMKKCSDPTQACTGCLFDHVCDKQEESGNDIMVSGANMILELLEEVDGCCGKCNSQEDDDNPSVSCADSSLSAREPLKGEAWQLGLYERAIAKWGEEAQIKKAVEELGELIVELARALNAGGVRDEHVLANIREELADACIMCDQLQLIFGDVSDWEMYKLERLERRLEQGL